jgi:hypothetical protein
MSEQKNPIWYENKIKRNIEYEKKNVVQVLVKINKNTESEILKHLEQQENKSGYIKQLILEDIAKKKNL